MPGSSNTEAEGKWSVVTVYVLVYTAQWARKWKRKMVNENLTDPIISAALCLISAAMTS